MSDAADVLIIGAGQGGLSASYYLMQAGIEHRVLDRGEIGHAWAAHRWDSFCLVTPNWTVNLPGRPYEGKDPDGFMLRNEFVTYLKDWAASFNAPVSEGIDVTRVTPGQSGFRLQTSRGEMRTRAVIIATATYQHPKVPAVATRMPAEILQLHAEQYKSTEQAAEGGVLVVGSGQTGCQIVEDFLREGRKTYLCVGRTGRLPRRYRGRDVLFWQRDMGLLDRTPDMLDSPADRFIGDPHLTGRDGGATVSLHDFRRRGVTLLGRLTDIESGMLHLKDDLAENMAFADRFCADLIARIDTHIEEQGIEAPAQTEAEFTGDPEAGVPLPQTPGTLDLVEAGINTIIWATGFTYDFSWIDDVPTDDLGYPVTDGGASPRTGLFFCGLNWMTKRKSGILYGVDEDARRVAEQVGSHLGQPCVNCL
ncbi:NAD(P)-binding domain-containing protein [Pelagibius sp. Alg239-R121]|uniref:NAD(P)-binding domain-containing protein n=1 Tax=Pelagibius sp. Alg239-R121 TaxID=2993448 RepID=UPI0024A75DE0|nr:NAD(P)-binding domain-containing protein [Pelagibius sp. Alg239-R121]